MSAAIDYLNHTASLVANVAISQSCAVEDAAQKCYQTIAKDRMIYSFGTGHSHILAEEIFYRAGGLVRVYPILDEPLMLHNGAVKSSMMERLEGYATVLAGQLPFQSGDVIFIFSNSGRNTVSVEMAQECKSKGMTVIAIVSKLHSAAVTSRHPSGKKLCDVADIVLDNGGCLGDAAMKIGKLSVGPTSTVVGAALMQAIVCRIVELCTESGTPVEVFSSSNVDNGDAINQKFIQKYSGIVRPL